MANWQSIAIPIAAVVLGFFLGILRQKLFEKKVSLSHKLDAPAVFSVIPPKTSFQNLKITNKGKLPAKNLRISLDADAIKKHETTYKPVTEEQYKEETREGILTLRFDTLLPGEELVISFKSTEPIPSDFLINIKSDEMLSKKESKENEKFLGSNVTQITAIALSALAVGIAFSAFSDRLVSKPPKQPILSLTIMSDKSIYGKGEKAEITYQIKNLKKDVLREVFGFLQIPGFEFNFDQGNVINKWIGGESQITHKVALNIPKNVPSGRYRIVLRVSAMAPKKFLQEITEYFFEVQ